MRPRTVALLLGSLATGGLVTALSRPDGFPHREHSAVFPVCTGCHAGIATGDAAAYYPQPDDCSRCHNGVTAARVNWAGPAPLVSNVYFQHPAHADAVLAGGDSTQCATCHQEADATGRMAVGPPRPDLCITCHAHAAPDHLAAEADCRGCHVPLVEATTLDLARIDNFPKPASHDATDFVLGHRPDTRAVEGTCAVCHAQESCLRCHLNGSEVAAIGVLQPDTRIALLAAGHPAVYPEPADHRRSGWAWGHADAAATDATRCANCHAQSSCRGCHQADASPAIAGLPVAHAGGPPGVIVSGHQSVHPTGFATRHGTGATLSDARCVNCHEQQESCFACHAGAAQPVFHRPNYRERHASDAYGGDQECASCHNTEGFCRACHAGVGVASQGRTNIGFHTAQPFWLLAHGQAARQGLAACASCHAQRDCARCHSALGAWRVNPHGPGFTGTGLQSRNRLACLTCHGTEPGRTP
jgi:predicted CXXCH cytochrome family protein